MDADEARAKWEEIMAAPREVRYGLFLSALEEEGEDGWTEGVEKAALIVGRRADRASLHGPGGTSHPTLESHALDQAHAEIRALLAPLAPKGSDDGTA